MYSVCHFQDGGGLRLRFVKHILGRPEKTTNQIISNLDVFMTVQNLVEIAAVSFDNTKVGIYLARLA